jgi:hypothetical protein
VLTPELTAQLVNPSEQAKVQWHINAGSPPTFFMLSRLFFLAWITTHDARARDDATTVQTSATSSKQSHHRDLRDGGTIPRRHELTLARSS